ncbi:hypothetical protein AAFF_G00340950 [Aldrovandia affinis]|uniref:Uncharacterized protein n=1 Tax=Aldrovandia affinis TaxID=143900 RepID=A0AAD7WPB2_9TELE|nr:hypothetical protein AAFF_G00340950 [Aldrovandia affinis]
MAKTRQVVGEQAEADGESGESTDLCDVDGELAVEPHIDALRDQAGTHQWPAPTLLRGVSGKIRVPNLTNVPQLVQKSHQLCRVRATVFGVYVRSAMGMPGSETALEELTCRVFGELLEQGHVAKVADDLYCGANTLEDLLAVWRRFSLPYGVVD